MPLAFRSPALLVLALLTAGASRAQEVPPEANRVPSRVAWADGFLNPESALYDADADVWFVSNINGTTLGKDNNGFISRLTGGGQVDSLRFVVGGRGGVTLHAPKGLALRGDTLWVTDIDAVRAFHRRTGAALAEVDLRPQGARFLNDPAFGGDGALYVTDTGITYDERGLPVRPSTDRVFRIAGAAASVAAEGAPLGMPNGIVWDEENDRFIVAQFGMDRLLAWQPGQTPSPLAVGPGQFDGLVVLPDGRVLVSSQATRAVHVVEGYALRPFVENVAGAADIGYDARRNRLAVPLIGQNRVEFYQLR